MYMHRRSWKSSSSPRIVGVQWSSTVGSTLWGMAPGVVIVLDIVLGLAEIAPTSWRLQRAAWSLLWGYRHLGVAWRHSEGPTGQGLVLVKAGAASEGRAHAVRGLREGGSLKEVWGIGSRVAGTVPNTSFTASQVPTVSPQRSEWRSSDQSWRTRLRSQPLWGMAA